MGSSESWRDNEKKYTPLEPNHSVPVKPSLRPIQLWVPGKVDMADVHFKEIFACEQGSFERKEVWRKCILWDWKNGKLVTAPLQECLNSFRKLADSKKDEDVLEFVRRWGPLEYESDERYWAVNPKPGQTEVNEYYYAEEFDLYREWAKRFQTLLKMGTALLNGKKGDIKDWDELWRAGQMHKTGRILNPDDLHINDNHNKAVKAMRQADLQTHRDEFSALLTALFLSTSIKPIVQWKQTGFALSLEPFTHDFEETWSVSNSILMIAAARRYDAFASEDYDNVTKRKPLFSNLVLQLICLLTDRNGMFVCGICGNYFTPETLQGRQDGRHYCKDECRKEANNIRVREYQRRKRGSKIKE